MKQTVELVPIFDDNYIFLIVDEQKKTAIAVDPGDATELIELLTARELNLTTILTTHHHADHIGGLGELVKRYNPEVYAPLKNKLQIAEANHFVSDGDSIMANGLLFEAIELPGHTLGHIAYYCKQWDWLFSGDVLFGLGCGRLFEGTAMQMFLSLAQIKNLPPHTQIFCTHEYTEVNLRFVEQLLNLYPDLITAEDLNNYSENLKSIRKKNQASVPLTLATELKANPFLRAKNLEEFTQFRTLRNNF